MTLGHLGTLRPSHQGFLVSPVDSRNDQLLRGCRSRVSGIAKIPETWGGPIP
jgi:hypothetical protein